MKNVWKCSNTRIKPSLVDLRRTPRNTRTLACHVDVQMDKGKTNQLHSMQQRQIHASLIARFWIWVWSRGRRKGRGCTSLDRRIGPGGRLRASYRSADGEQRRDIAEAARRDASIALWYGVTSHARYPSIHPHVCTRGSNGPSRAGRSSSSRRWVGH